MKPSTDEYYQASYLPDRINTMRSWRAWQEKSLAFLSIGSIQWFYVFYPEIEILSPEEAYMAKKRYDIEFANVKLDAKQRKEIKALYENGDFDLWLQITNLNTDGYRLSLSFNADKDTFICSLTAKEEAPFNTGFCMTSHAKDPQLAVTIALYKHYHVCSGEDWQRAAEGDEEFG